MPQMLTSQNKPECESQDHFEWCQLSARQPVSQKYHCLPRVCLCVLSLHTSLWACLLTFLHVWMLPLQIQMCTHVLRVLVILDVFVSSSGGRVQPWGGERQLTSPLSPDSGTDRRQKTPQETRKCRLGLLTGGCQEHDKSIHTCWKEKKRGHWIHDSRTK